LYSHAAGPVVEDLLWHLGWFVNSGPRWAGFMHDEEHSVPPSATIRMFLLIECNAIIIHVFTALYCSFVSSQPVFKFPRHVSHLIS